jgi:hypothetical protein
LLLGPDSHAAPGIGQVAGGALVVGQAGAGDGGHRGGDALVIEGELGGREAVLAGPLIPVTQAESLGQQRPLRRQPPCLLGLMASRRPGGVATGLPSPQPPANQTGS